MNGSVYGITAENIVVFKCFLHEVLMSLFFKFIITISFLFFPQKIDWKKKQNIMWVVEIRRAPDEICSMVSQVYHAEEVPESSWKFSWDGAIRWRWRHCQIWETLNFEYMNA